MLLDVIQMHGVRGKTVVTEDRKAMGTKMVQRRCGSSLISLGME